MLVVVVAFVGLFVYYLFDTGQFGPVSYMECGSGRDCIETAIYECEPAKATIGDTQVTVNGEIKVQGEFGGSSVGVIEVCKVTFTHPDHTTTCGLPSMYLTKSYSIEQYEYEMEKYCTSGISAPMSTK